MSDRLHLIDYLPPVLKSVTEYIAVTGAQQPSVDDAWDAYYKIMNNQFIDTADEDGIAVWEDELSIVPMSTDTLDERRRRIKAMWTYGVAYTMKWLKDWLYTSTGSETVVPSVSDYTLSISVPISSDYIHIVSDLRETVPANIQIVPNIHLSETSLKLYQSFVLHIGLTQSMTMEQSDIT